MTQPAVANSVTTTPKRVFLIDTSGFIFRAYHVMRPLTRSDGTPVQAVYGYVSMIMKLIEQMKIVPGEDVVATVFDAGRITFRNRMYGDYKAHRPEAPEDLIPQFPIVREATIALGLPMLELADYEADDLIAAYCKQACEMGAEVIIVSSDKDLMQLVGTCVKMYDAMKDKVIGPDEVREKFGVGPDKVLDVLSLIGDSSDNVPGVPGIGPKTAAELINQFGSLDALLERAGEIKQAKRKEVIQTHTQQAKLSRDLVRLCDDCPVPKPLSEMLYALPDETTAISFMEAQGFKTLIPRFKQKLGMATLESRHGGEHEISPVQAHREDKIVKPAIVLPESKPAHYVLVQDETALNTWIKKATLAGCVAFDTETDSLNAMQANLVGISLCVEPFEACYIPLNHLGLLDGAPTAGQQNLFDAPQTSKSLQRLPEQLTAERALELLKPLLTDSAVLKIGQNIKYDMLVLKKYGVEITPYDDTMLFSYVLAAGERNHGMNELAEKILGHHCISYDSVTGTGRARTSFAEVALDKARDYAAEDADVTLRLSDALKPQLVSQRLVNVYETLERPLVAVLRDMEARGIKVDVAFLNSLSTDFEKRLAQLEKKIHQIAGVEFSIGSPKQLGEVLFDNLQLPGGKKSGKSGNYGTDAGILEDLASQGYDIAREVLNWRQLAKLKSTYTDALPNQVNARTSRVHTSYSMAVASTGRLSSTDPNLQNIPIRTEEGKLIRNAFIAEEGYSLLSADYSQIELRLLAHVAEMDSLKEAFRNQQDIHTITASQMFGTPLSDVTSDMRRNAKMINFGIIYGISAHGLASRLGIGRSEAGDYIKKYFMQYPGIQEYMERTKEFAREHGYVTTLYGRRCHVPGINDKNPNMRAFSERAAINAPLQGTAADIIKRAMITLDRTINEENLPVRMLLQVHDELVFEVKTEHAEPMAQRIKRIMEQAANLSVPLVVETGIGKHWGEAH